MKGFIPWIKAFFTPLLLMYFALFFPRVSPPGKEWALVVVNTLTAKVTFTPTLLLSYLIVVHNIWVWGLKGGNAVEVVDLVEFSFNIETVGCE